MRLLLTGGGTGGHILPCIALIDELKRHGDHTILYVGEQQSVEAELLKKEKVPFKGIACGKLRRYFDWKNFTDPLRVVKGFFQARKIVREFQPDVVFSKGGYVSVPVSFAAFSLRMTTVIHESDVIPGLATKLQMPFAKAVCVSFEETMHSLPRRFWKKTIVTGHPLRPAISAGDAAEGARLTHFNREIGVVLFMGGSSGAEALNELLRKSLPELLQHVQVIHLFGPKQKKAEIKHPRYFAEAYVDGDAMGHFYALSDVVVSRAGAGAIFEILENAKPAIFIPLPRSASRGEQLRNARLLEAKDAAIVLREERLTSEKLTQEILTLARDSGARKRMSEAASAFATRRARAALCELLLSFAQKKRR